MATDAEPITEDGPVEPDGFCWRGRIYTGMRPTPWRLVNALWSARNRTASVDTLAEPVFEDHDAPERHRVAPHASRANSWFEWHALPFRVRAKNRFLQLIQRPDETATERQHFGNTTGV